MVNISYPVGNKTSIESNDTDISAMDTAYKLADTNLDTAYKAADLVIDTAYKASDVDIQNQIDTLQSWIRL